MGEEEEEDERRVKRGEEDRKHRWSSQLFKVKVLPSVSGAN